MGNPTCRDCGEREAVVRGYCKRCYGVLRRRGDLHSLEVHLQWPENLLQRMEPQVNGCIWFTGHIARDGYGDMRYPGGRLAHRAAYEHFVGPIAEGMTVDHECHNADRSCAGGSSCLHRRCVNVEHMAVKPQGDNCNASPNSNAAKTHCPQGHAYDGENTAVRDGRRFCLICKRKTDRMYQARRRAQTKE